ncbi:MULTISPECIES: PIN domain-containing protein [Sphaerimonospora]|uniref:Uncharacterized protein n=2 Tax=Sphaerimonospora TaxID=1792303 RepID=A0A8J3RAF8_9ACTN|nr:PIN domain-containing protein [Sphaerimonospora thailandensis]GIH68983.1 hypothetical protein Mth01_12360 [Sphaerimonospora thailandensis]
MSVRPIIDAGPALNFFSINKERLLLATLGPISTPETVEQEVLRKAATDPRFYAAERVWKRLPPRLLQILSDDVTPELAAVVHRLTGLPMIDRTRKAKDLGEIMVIAHAVVAAESGQAVTVLIDDGYGARLASSEIRRLDRLRSQGRPIGSIRLASTHTVLERAAGGQYLPDREAMCEVYTRLRRCDDGLPPIGTTRLLARDLWT